MTRGPGLYPDVLESQYHTDSAVSQSGLKTLLECPARYKWQLDNPPPPKDVYDFGHAVHAKVLGTGLDVVEVEADTWQTKAAREAKVQAHAAGKVPLLTKDVTKVHAMAEVVLAHPAARAVLEAEGQSEVSAWWTDPETGVPCRGRFDRLTQMSDGTPTIVDLKTSPSAAPAKFAKSVYDFGYGAQQDMYVGGHEVITGHRPEYVIVVVEKDAPHVTEVYTLDSIAVERGHWAIRDALALYVHCAETDTWPGYTGSADITILPSPRWAS